MGKVDLVLIRQAKKPSTDTLSPCVDGPGAGLDQVAYSGHRPHAKRNSRFSRQALLRAAIGCAIRDYRRRHELTGLNLANAAGISLSMLSRIENGTVSPSLRTLQALATALGVPLTALLGRYNEQSRAVFVPSLKREGVDDNLARVSGLFVREKSSFGSVALDAHMITVTAQADKLTTFEEPGMFFVHCLSGEVTYLHATKWYHMASGDSLFFDADGPHGVASPNELPARLLVIRAYPASDAVVSIGSR